MFRRLLLTLAIGFLTSCGLQQQPIVVETKPEFAKIDGSHRLPYLTLNQAYPGTNADFKPVSEATPSALKKKCRFVTSLDTRETPDIRRPDYLEAYEDPAFGQRVIRVTGDVGTTIPIIGGTWPRVARHHYSTDFAWNADGTILHLAKSNIFLNGETYAPLFRQKGPSSHKRWHPVDPDLFIYVHDNAVGLWNVRTDKVVTVREFSNYSDVRLGPNKGTLSFDGDRIALLATRRDGKIVAFAYDLATDTKYPDINPFKDGWLVSWIGMSPLGNYMVQISHGHKLRVFDLFGRTIQRAHYDAIKHHDLTVDDNGDEVAIGIRNRPPNGGRVVKIRLRDLKETFLTDRGFGNHVSTRSIRNREWAIVSFDDVSMTYRPFQREIVMVAVSGSGAIRRLAHSHSSRTEYLAETHAVGSPTGTKVAFASTWNNTDNSIGTYVIELCRE